MSKQSIYSRDAICNEALSHLSQSTGISDFDGDRPDEKACNFWYKRSLRRVLEGYPWSFANNISSLGAPKKEFDDDFPLDWKYGYEYPSDCVELIRVFKEEKENRLGNVDWLYKDPEIPPPYKGVIKTTWCIYSNVKDAWAEYITDELDGKRLPQSFVEAFALRLAYDIAPRISKGLIYRATVKTDYVAALSKARSIDDEQNRIVLEAPNSVTAGAPKADWYWS